MKRTALLILILCATVFSGFAQMNTTNPRTKMKSLFMFKFTQYTEWPEAYKQGEFVIGVVNDEDLAAELEKAAATKKVNSQSVVIKRFKSAAEVSQCHVLYVGGNTAAEVNPFVGKVKDFSCLVITEGQGLVESTSAINYVVVGANIRFEMNRRLFDDQDLIVSNTLDRLATRVIN